MADSQTTDILEQKIGRLKWANDDLRSKLFEANQRSTRLAQEFGFADETHAYESIANNSMESNVPKLNDRVRTLEEELRNHIAISKEVLQNFEAIQRENQGLRSQLTDVKQEEFSQALTPKHKRISHALNNKENSPTSNHSPTASGSRTADFIQPASQVLQLQSQLADLQERHDHVVAAKAKATRKFAEDYRKWKEFKQWLGSTDQGLKRVEKARNKRSKLSQRIKRETSTAPSTSSSLEHPMKASDSDTEDDSQNPFLNTSTSTLRPTSDFKAEEDITLQVKEEGATPVPDSSRKGKRPLDEYLGFKGRGRYKKTLNEDQDTINAKFVIDPSRNEGLDYQFDAVVRNKEERKRLHAGDCECCRDYYNAIGPLPPRLKPPLWRTPPSSPAQGEVDRSVEEQEVSNHKKEISKHRHNWALPTTPPKYWSIGFPTTQEVMDINMQAEEMTNKKRRAAEMEANEGGRYKRR